MKKALVLLSGGLDSATTLAIARDRGYEVTAMSFDYGQRHKVELARSKRLCTEFNVSHVLMHVPLSAMGGSALTDPNIDVPDTPGLFPTYHTPTQRAKAMEKYGHYLEAGD